MIVNNSPFQLWEYDAFIIPIYKTGNYVQVQPCCPLVTSPKFSDCTKFNQKNASSSPAPSRLRSTSCFPPLSTKNSILRHYWCRLCLPCQMCITLWWRCCSAGVDWARSTLTSPCTNKSSTFRREYFSTKRPDFCCSSSKSSPEIWYFRSSPGLPLTAVPLSSQRTARRSLPHYRCCRRRWSWWGNIWGVRRR